MNEILSAASLLLAVVGVLYGLWYPEIIRALEKKVPTHPEDRPAPYREISAIFFSRALPLCISAVLVALVFLPEALTILLVSIRFLINSSIEAYLAGYDTVRTAFILVEILAIGIATHSVVLTVKLGKLRKQLRSS